MSQLTERFDPLETPGSLLEAEHRARYQLAATYVRDKLVLDAACGVAWGSELFLAAGAKNVVGIDIALEALRIAKSRVSARLAAGDVLALPLPDALFDVVVSFETIEHTTDWILAIDELVRVLRPGGLLFVSSPNPSVYPPGNPFHVYEVPPDDLYDTVKARLPNAALCRQHLLASSVILPSRMSESTFDGDTTSVVSLGPGHDPYAVVVASSAPLPQLRAVNIFAPASIFDHFSTLASVLEDERQQMREDHARIVDERTRLLAEMDELIRRADSPTEIEDSQALQRRLKRAEEAVQRLADERDQLAAALIDSEQVLAKERLAQVHER